MFREALLQSTEWQHFQEKNGRLCLRGEFGLGVVETLPIVGKYLYVPRGPILDISNIKNQKSKIDAELLKAAEETEAGWVRIEPGSEEELEVLKQVFGVGNMVRAPHDAQPREILVMDIVPSETELLSTMKPKTRYNIRLAEKHGVSVRFSREARDMETFIDLIYATTERKAIRPHPKEYYRNFFATFNSERCTLALAEYEGQVLAANLLVFFEGTAYYLHGGSSDEGRHLMAPFFLQWESIREAKRRGMTQYNFGGVKTQPTTHNPQPTTSSWEGITRFKQGFAPATQPIVFPGTYDIIVSPWRYRAYRWLRRAQQLKKYFVKWL